MDKRKLLLLGLVILLYVLSSGISYKVFSNVLVPGVSSPVVAPTVGPEGKMTFDPNLPKTEPCPLNGAKYSKQQRKWWEEHRPLGVMIENHREARPQSGLSSADVIYEAVAEGGITRFLAIFYCQDPGQLGPVRSARTYYIDFLSEYGSFPLYAHVGGANAPGPADALSQISTYEWTAYNDLNQFSIGFPVFWRDYERLGRNVATEHTMYSSGQKLWDYAAKTRKLTDVDKDGDKWSDNYTSYSFKDDAGASQRGKSQSIHLEFWKSMPDYFVDWTYDPIVNTYKRNDGRNGGKPHFDKNTNKQITAKNVVVLSMIENNANDGYENNVHLLYKTKGTGKATIFMDSKEISGTWKKDSRTGRTIVRDSSGKEVEFNRGLIWFHILPTQTGVVKVQ